MDSEGPLVEKMKLSNKILTGYNKVYLQIYKVVTKDMIKWFTKYLNSIIISELLLKNIITRSPDWAP